VLFLYSLKTASLSRLVPHLLKDVQIDSTIFRPATFIEMSLRNLDETLMISGVLVALILVVFLFEWRTVLISVVAMPLCALFGGVVVWWRRRR